jgi:hypothetical protein
MVLGSASTISPSSSILSSLGTYLPPSSFMETALWERGRMTENTAQHGSRRANFMVANLP